MDNRFSKKGAVASSFSLTSSERCNRGSACEFCSSHGGSLRPRRAWQEARSGSAREFCSFLLMSMTSADSDVQDPRTASFCLSAGNVKHVANEDRSRFQQFRAVFGSKLSRAFLIKAACAVSICRVGSCPRARSSIPAKADALENYFNVLSPGRAQPVRLRCFPDRFLFAGKAIRCSVAALFLLPYSSRIFP